MVPPMPAHGPCVCWQGVGRTGHAQLGKYALCFSPTCSGCGPRAGEASLPPSCCLLQTHLGSRPQTHTGLSKKQHPPQFWNVPAGQGRQKSLREKWQSGGKSGNLVPKGSPRNERSRRQGWPSPPAGRSGLLQGMAFMSASCPHSCFSPLPSASTRHWLPFPQLPREPRV